MLYQVLGDTSQNVTAPHQLIAQASNSFTIKMYDALKEQDGNLFVSPFSLEVLLAMLYLGSKGAVANEIQAALNLPQDECVVKEGYKELISRAENSEPLEIATKMFAQLSFIIKDIFLADAQNYFYSGIESVDYVNKPQEAVAAINSFAAEKTHGKITKLLDKVAPDTVLVLVNALYFKADWKYQFPSSEQQKFYITKENSKDVDMMYITEDLKYKHDTNLGAQIVEIPYKGDEYSMIIMLPDEVEGLRDVENKIAGSNFENIMDGLWKVEVNLRLPKFKLEQQIELNDVLQKLGMRTMFLPGRADLSGISDEPLYVSRAIQKTYINVDENGTEAAAVTGLVVGITSVSLDPVRKIYVTVDHPFIFMITYKPINTILFKGRLSNPS